MIFSVEDMRSYKRRMAMKRNMKVLHASASALLFCGALVILACGFILYDTSNVLHHYRTDQHVGAALELFASLALLFYYILRISIYLYLAANND